ncbi:hypothetical protein SAMN06295885_2240 [Rathayibacter oskolensis]|uniref:Uncharacterized protein n=1 Tax=Rathayibacter oskolensis TaxID=1891671 RepID=A0A1X7P130_9MICO|nr:hypothetical protein [Rathayibacter oskolensis]SMH43841.1 hypothetical protein SAMN06295885_2240 [Rathayibacter oskolensis]
MDWEIWNQGLWALLPTLSVGLIFWFVMRAVIRSDRNERRAYDRIEAQERAKRGLPPRDAS